MTCGGFVFVIYFDTPKPEEREEKNENYAPLPYEVCIFT